MCRADGGLGLSDCVAGRKLAGTGSGETIALTRPRNNEFIEVRLHLRLISLDCLFFLRMTAARAYKAHPHEFTVAVSRQPLQQARNWRLSAGH